MKICGSSIYYKADADDNFTALTLDFTLNSGLITRFLVYSDLLIMVNGGNYPFFWDGDISHNVHRLGIPEPPAGASGGDGSGGSGSLDTGANYFYIFTYYNNETGHESNAAAANAAAYQTAATGQIDVTIPQDAAVDSQVTHIRLYRTEGGGTIDGPFLWTGENHAVGSLAAGDVVISDTIADSALSTECDWTNRYYPGYGSGTDMQFLEVINEICFFAGDDTNPSRLYHSNTGYPERHDSAAFYDIGKNAGDRITGLKAFRGMLVIFKERSIYAMFQPYDPNSVNIVEITRAHGLLAKDSLVDDGNLLRWIDVDGWKVFDGSRVGMMAGGNKISAFFDADNELSMPLPTLKNIRSVVYNRELMSCYPTKESDANNNVVKLTTQVNSDTGSERKQASFSADYGEGSFESGTDARMVLDNTQSSLNKYLEVSLYVPFDDSQWRQDVRFSIFFSFDSGVSWKKVYTHSHRMQILNNIPGDFQPRRIPRSLGESIYPIRQLKFTFNEGGVTDVRVDLHYSAANGELNSEYGDENDENRLTYIELTGIGYYYVDTSETVEMDRALSFNLDSGKWSTPLVGIKPNVWALGDRANDLYELYYGASDEGQVWQYGIGDYDGSQRILGYLNTKHFGNKDGIRMQFDRIFLKMLAEEGEFTLSMFVDMVERSRKRVRTDSIKAYFGKAYYGGSHFGGSQGLLEKVINLGREGEYIMMQFMRYRDDRMPLMQFEIEGKVLEY